jgi:3-hydroxyacyl-[acyl-carrier-protein] dehydratase
MNKMDGSDRRKSPSGRENPSLMDQRVPGGMDILQIMTRLPHRYPLLLIDRILELEPGERIVGLKNVSMGEPFFVGHLSGNPIMPPVLIVEAMAQVGAVLVSFRPDAAGYTTHLLSVERVRFLRLVRPGDQLIIRVVGLRGKGRFGKAQATAEVDGGIAAEGVLTYGMMRDQSGSSSWGRPERER